MQTPAAAGRSSVTLCPGGGRRWVLTRAVMLPVYLRAAALISQSASLGIGHVRLTPAEAGIEAPLQPRTIAPKITMPRYCPPSPPVL